MSGAEAVKVIVRCRPLNTREKDLKCGVVVGMDPAIIQVQLTKPKSSNVPPKLFTFDGVYFMADTTQQIYEDICFPLVAGVLEGYNGTVFAYGQTGCGKSFTMMGVETPKENQGVIPRAFGHIFEHIAVNGSIKYLVRASYLEIYNEEVRDLLGSDSKKKLDLKEHPDKGVYVKDLSYHKVHNVKDLERVMELGSSNRSVGATLMNVDSSRSHSIFTIDLEMMDKDGGSDGKGSLRAGKLNLVDLAGSERQSKTGSTGERLKEATKINLSLSALGNVISALVDGKSKHIPYRDSKLTRLLQSSLGGNTKTLMVACISPADNNYDETLSTLRYANRAKNIKNKPRINEDPKDALLREYQEEIKKLKMMLMGQLPMDVGGKDKPGVSHESSGSSQKVKEPTAAQLKAWEEEKESIRREYESNIADLKEKFGREQADKEQLQQELNKLQEERDQQLDLAKSKLDEAVVDSEEGQEAVVEDQTRGETEAKVEGAEGKHEVAWSKDTKPMEDKKSAEAVTLESLPSEEYHEKTPSVPSTVLGSPPASPTLPALPTDAVPALSSKDKSEHELAFKRLEELQNRLIGGEKADDEEMRRQFRERQLAAEQRQKEMTKAMLFEAEDDNVLEKIFNNLTDEVRVKTKVIERTQAKLLSAEEDVKDLQAEFELDRQDYLDTIRTQDKQIKLYEQLLATVVPCLRRDCNYFNIDKIRVECKWNEEGRQWILPKLVINKTILSPAAPGNPPSKASLDRSRKTSKCSVVSGATPKHSANKYGGSGEVNVRESSSSLLRGQMPSFYPGSYDNSDDERSSLNFQKSDDSAEYFKPKRALELINQGPPYSLKEASPMHMAESMSGGSMKPSGSLNSMPNAAAVHGVDPLKDSNFGRRPGKLQSLAVNPPVPQTFTSKQEQGILEKMDKLPARKKNNLEPLTDIKSSKRHH